MLGSLQHHYANFTPHGTQTEKSPVQVTAHTDMCIHMHMNMKSCAVHVKSCTVHVSQW